MKIKFSTFFFFLLTTLINAQSKDTIAAAEKQKKITVKQFILPATLITTGALLIDTKLNKDLQSNSGKLFGNDFDTATDDYIQFAPILQIYLGHFLGVKSKNNFQQQTINLIVANLMMGAAVQITKRTVKEERPDQSNNHSFPSGHTATAFTSASVLFYEYKDSNLWYASSGFLFATATGVLRIANNKHYTADVITGAGIGIASGLIVSYWNPFQSLTLGKKKKTTAFVYPQIGNQIGMGLHLQID